MTDLRGSVVTDQYGREYTVQKHHIEADELLLKRGRETHSITLMDIADGPFNLVKK